MVGTDTGNTTAAAGGWDGTVRFGERRNDASLESDLRGVRLERDHFLLVRLVSNVLPAVVPTISDVSPADTSEGEGENRD